MAERLRDKFKKVIGLEDEVEYEETEEYEEYGSYEGRGSYRRDPEPQYDDYSRVRNMSSGTARTQSSPRDDYATPHMEQRGKVVDLNGASEAAAAKRSRKETIMKLVITEATNLNDCPKLVDNLKLHKPVILNMGTVTDKSVKHKIFNFMTGATYALEGKVQKITDEIFIFAPVNVEVDTIENDENGNPKNVSMKDLSWK